jgi:hypothetical protein
MKESLKIFHVTSWNIPNILFFHVEIIYDVAKYSMPCHGILCHVTCMIYCEINNDLLILNMDLTNIFVTLTLGSRPRQGLARLRAKKKAWE